MNFRWRGIRSPRCGARRRWLTAGSWKARISTTDTWNSTIQSGSSGDRYILCPRSTTNIWSILTVIICPLLILWLILELCDSYGTGIMSTNRVWLIIGILVIIPIVIPHVSLVIIAAALVSSGRLIISSIVMSAWITCRGPIRACNLKWGVRPIRRSTWCWIWSHLLSLRIRRVSLWRIAISWVACIRSVFVSMGVSRSWVWCICTRFLESICCSQSRVCCGGQAALNISRNFCPLIMMIAWIGSKPIFRRTISCPVCTPCGSLCTCSRRREIGMTVCRHMHLACF